MVTKNTLDTHTLLWFLADDPRLGPNAGAVLEDPESELVLPAIVLAEACWIVQRGRIALSVLDLLAAIDADPRIQVVALDRTIIERSVGLTAIGEMHDRQIVATVLVLQDKGETVRLLTADRDITASGVIPIIW